MCCGCCCFAALSINPLTPPPQKNTTHPTKKLVAAPTPAGVLGLTVCYDLRFPEMYQALTWGPHGATLLSVPSAFTKGTGEAHGEL